MGNAYEVLFLKQIRIFEQYCAEKFLAHITRGEREEKERGGGWMERYSRHRETAGPAEAFGKGGREAARRAARRSLPGQFRGRLGVGARRWEGGGMQRDSRPREGLGVPGDTAAAPHGGSRVCVCVCRGGGGGGVVARPTPLRGAGERLKLWLRGGGGHPVAKLKKKKK